jgi:hypothetical protein
MAYYHTLLVKWEKNDRWEIHFGDADSDVVFAEAADMDDEHMVDPPYATKIVRTETSSQEEINAAVKLINDTEIGVLPDPPQRPEYPGYMEAKDMVGLLGIMSAIVRAGDVREIRSNGDCVTVAADLLDIVVAKVNRASGWMD